MKNPDWQALLDRLHTKSLAVAERSAHKIPYTTENGVFDDFSENDHLLEKCSEAYHDTKHEFAIIYGDYYFVEAVLKLCGKETFLW